MTEHKYDEAKLDACIEAFGNDIDDLERECMTKALDAYGVPELEQKAARVDALERENSDLQAKLVHATRLADCAGVSLVADVYMQSNLPSWYALNNALEAARKAGL